ncbi:MAG: helix-hairpin-helix domain-containing protein [Kiritimatiellae bacterium]|nr:helix-hairpin-helix domain-containing protein [Kiritimatiellia bacterium]
MKNRFSKRLALLAVLCALADGIAVRAGEDKTLTRLRDAVLAEAPGNDGDSFAIEAQGQGLRVRLYFVDTPELEASWDVDVRRVREQMRYFGLPGEKKIIEYGQRAAEFVREQLARPFEVYTSYAAALGRSPEHRFYAFVRTADGQDLAELLVRAGLARTYGVGRQTPDGTGRNEMRARLSDLEAAAMLKRAGIWTDADSERLAELRAQQRKEDSELQAIRMDLEGQVMPEFPLNINTCTAEELDAVRGIGPVLARRIVETRPHPSLEHLLKIRGVHARHLAAWSEFLVTE